MFKVSKRNLAAPSPMIAGFYILQIKGIRWVCNDIFVNAFRSFDLEDTDPEKGQMSGIQELFEVGDVLIGIHVVIDICALLHDLSVFINEKSFYRDIEFLEMVRKIFLIGRKQAA